MTDTIHKYHITIHTHDRRASVDADDIQVILKYLEVYYYIYISGGVYETGRYGGSHYHAVARSLVKVSYKTVSSIGGYRLYWKEIKSQRYATNIHKYHSKQNPSKTVKSDDSFMTGKTELYKQFVESLDMQSTNVYLGKDVNESSPRTLGASGPNKSDV